VYTGIVKVLKVFLGIFAIGGLIVLYTQLNQPKQPIFILMKKDQFEPATIQIKKGTKVIFKNEDSDPRWPASNLHPTHGIYPQFDPTLPIEPGKEWSFIFNQVGNWKYHDHLSPSLRGQVTVIQ